MGIGLGAITNPSVTLDEIFSYLNHAGKPCLVAITLDKGVYQVYDQFFLLWLRKKLYPAF